MLPCHRVHDPRDRRRRVRRQPHRPGAARRRSPGRRDGPRRRGGRRGPRPAPAAQSIRRRASRGRRHAAGHPAGRRWPASTPSSTWWRSRATSTAAPIWPGSTPRAPARVLAAMTAAGVRRLVHLGALGVADDPRLHYASSKARAEAAVRESGLDWTILKPSLQFGPGDGFFNIVAGLVRLSPGIVPVPGDGKSRFQPIFVGDVAARRGPLARGSVDDRRDVRAGRAALLDVSRDHRGGPACARQAPGDRAGADPADPAGGRCGRAGPPAVPRGDRPAPPAPPRQHRAARPDPVAVRLRAAPDGGCPGLPPAQAARPVRRRPDEPCRSGSARSPSDRSRRRSGASPSTVGWLGLLVVIGLGGAGIVNAMDHQPGHAPLAPS